MCVAAQGQLHNGRHHAALPRRLSASQDCLCGTPREESAQLQAENAQRSDAMQTRLDALQALKDEVATADCFIADVDQRVRYGLPCTAARRVCHGVELPGHKTAAVDG